MHFPRLRTFALLGIAVLPGTAVAEPISATGYMAGCGEEGCFIAVDGYLLHASATSTAPELLSGLADLPLLSAVSIEGDLTNLADSTGDLTLASYARVEDDPYEGNLQAMQGEWAVIGADTPFLVNVSGMIWQEIVQGELAASYALTVGEACADGVEPGGMALVLYQLGDDPEADACWQVEYIDESSMVLRDFFSDQGQVEWVRP